MARHTLETGAAARKLEEVAAAASNAL